MKRIIALLLALVTVCCFAACGEEKELSGDRVLNSVKKIDVNEREEEDESERDNTGVSASNLADSTVKETVASASEQLDDYSWENSDGKKVFQYRTEGIVFKNSFDYVSEQIEKSAQSPKTIKHIMGAKKDVSGDEKKNINNVAVYKHILGENKDMTADVYLNKQAANLNFDPTVNPENGFCGKADACSIINDVTSDSDQPIQKIIAFKSADGNNMVFVIITANTKENIENLQKAFGAM